MYKIMIVEDEVFARIGLEQAINWDALQLKLLPSASNGREALELYRQFHPDIIVTDIKMPEMDGLELISAVRTENKRMCGLLSCPAWRTTRRQRLPSICLYRSITINMIWILPGWSPT